MQFIFSAMIALMLSGASQVRAQVPIAGPIESILTWKPEQQIKLYPAIETVYETRVVKRGAAVAPLPRSASPLNLSVVWESKSRSIDEFMQAQRITGLLVLKNGHVVFERYAFGRKATDRWTSFSVAKSITSTLVGAAIRDGYIKNLDTDVTTYIHELSGSAYEHVTVRQLLTMTSGVRWNEDYGDPNSDVALSSRALAPPGVQPLVEYMRKLPRETTPGTRFHYKTGETDLVGILVARATGKPLAEYLSEKIWQPYGMEQDAIWMVDRAHMERGGCCMSMTLRDYARFGQFMLDGGRASGASILPEGWIAAATSNQLSNAMLIDVDRINPGHGYGYFWWTQPDGSFEANGIFGQIIKVFPRDRIVIAINSATLKATSPKNNAAMVALYDAIRAAAK